jgi:hypothetical protein
VQNAPSWFRRLRHETDKANNQEFHRWLAHETDQVNHQGMNPLIMHYPRRRVLE